MQNTEFELMVSPGRQPVLFLALASIFFSAMLFFFYDAAMAFFHHGFNDDSARFAGSRAEIVAVCFVLGLRFSMIKDVLIDVDTSLLISRYRVGPFSRDVRGKCPNLEYIAVFKNAKEMFEVNLWYKGNRHYKMYQFDKINDAFKFAHIVSKKLKLELLDATVKNDFKWLVVEE